MFYADPVRYSEAQRQFDFHADRLIEYMKTSDVVAYHAAISSPIIIEIWIIIS